MQPLRESGLPSPTNKTKTNHYILALDVKIG